MALRGIRIAEFRVRLPVSPPPPKGNPSLSMYRKVSFAIGEYYHLYNRGTEQRDIFLSDYDLSRFAFLLYVCNSNKHIDVRKLKEDNKNEGLPFGKIDRGDVIVDIGSWCLMPNHFHMLVKERMEGGITRFMLKLTTAYSMYFNKLYKRSGRLFQGPFQSSHAGKDNYLKYLFAYIHLNPIKLIEPNWKETGILDKVSSQKYLSNYKYSSCLDYTGISRDFGSILNKSSFPGYFSSPHEFLDFINDWLSYEG